MVHPFLSVLLLVKIALKQGVFAYDCNYGLVWGKGEIGKVWLAEVDGASVTPLELESHPTSPK